MVIVPLLALLAVIFAIKLLVTELGHLLNAILVVDLLIDELQQ
jgi:hypothetical protein